MLVGHSRTGHGQRVFRMRGGDRLTFFLGCWLTPLTLLRLLMTSVLRLIGRALPWSFKKSPQALHSTEPDSSRRHSGVVDV